ncbi:Immediate early response protein (IER) [Mactra antiquata]
MATSSDAQRLIAVSLGKIALSRQQRGGINLHKNLLVASVLHKARTTYMMDNFQTLLANKRSQAEREAAAKMIVEKSEEKTEKTMEINSESRGFENSIDRDVEVPHGECTEINNNVGKENVTPVIAGKHEETSNCDNNIDKNSDMKSKTKEFTQGVQISTLKTPLSVHNGSTGYVSQMNSCRCAGGKRRRSFVEMNESVTEPKKARFDDELVQSDSECDYDSDSNDSVEHMQTESTQVTNLVDIFNTGFNGLIKDNEPKQSSGHINVYVSADRPLSGHQYVLTDISCSKQVKDNVALPSAIALAV